MFDKLRLKRELRGRYDELFELNKGIKQLNNYFKFKIPKTVSSDIRKDLKNALKELANSPDNKEELDRILLNRNKIKRGIEKSDKDSSAELCLKLLNVITYNLDKEILFSASNDETDIFSLFNNINTSHLNFAESYQINRLIEILDVSNNEDIILTVLIFLKNIEYGCDTAFFNKVCDSITKACLDIKCQQLYNIFYLFWNLKNEKVEDVIYAFLEQVDTKFENKDVDIQLNKLIQVIFSEVTYAYKYINIDVLKRLLEIIKIENKDNNIKLILHLLGIKKFLMMEDTSLQLQIINTLIELDIKNERYSDNLLKIITGILLSECDNNIKLHILNKLKEIKSIESLEMLLKIYPFINSYTSVEETPKVINDLLNLEKNGSIKKKILTIPLQ